MAAKKTFYKKRILKELYFTPSLSCADLFLRINKSFPLITKLLNELMEQGLVIETGYAASTGGRRPQTYAIKEDVMYVVSVAMDQFVTRIAIMDMQNQTVSELKKFELNLAENLDALSSLIEKIEEIIDSTGIDIKKIIGVGIGMPGFVNAQKGINYTFFKSPGKSISQLISDQLGLPVYIDNDSSLVALAELRFGSARKRKNAMVINIGWGIGLGMILNGELFRGHDGFAGEFSHIPLFNNGKLCSCGKSGCLETETSLVTIVEKAKEGLNTHRLTKMGKGSFDHLEQAIEIIMAAAQEGDRFAVELFTEAGYNIGRGVAILIHLLNPEIVILSGRGSSAGKVLMAPIQQALNEHCIPRLSHSTELEISKLGYMAELIGAAALVMENFEKENNKNYVASLEGILSRDYTS
ncbi:MAG: ROK family protein [Ginsengibacter sp.]